MLGRLFRPAADAAPARAEPVAAPAPAAPRQDRSLEDLIGLLERDLRRAGGRLAEAGAEIRAAAEDSARQVERIGAESREMVGETGRAKTDAEIIAQAMQEFSASSASVGRQADESTRLVNEADRAAGDATARIDDLKRAIGDIQTVVSLITEIAGQTNLLALNATIEAARAGAAGRGFAVVAQEVKSLSMETQKATAEIGSRIARLHEAAEQSIGAVGRVIGIINEIRPAALAVAEAVEGQEGAIREVATTAAQNVAFADTVRNRALAIEEATRAAIQVGAAVDSSTGRMDQTVGTMTRQLVTVLRQTPAGDRRKHDRWPVEIHGVFGPRRVPVHSIDLSLGGVLLAPEPSIRCGDAGRLELHGLAPIEARVVETSPLGLHVAFRTEAAPDLAARVAAVAEDYRVPIERARAGAKAISEAMEAACRSGRLSTASLFDGQYRPIPGTDPQQYETASLAVLEAILPPIQEPLLAEDERLTFAAAVDVNAYLPVHNKKYAQPQRRGDPVWNAANSRNRRIFDDRAGLIAARNTRPFLVQSYARDLGGGNVVVMKEVDAPIVVDGRHWGGFRTAYRF